MGNQNISVELASMQQAVSTMNSKAVNEITSLHSDWSGFTGELSNDLWSSEDACLAFGSSYVSAIQAYQQVLQGMVSDITRYRDELKTCHDEYLNKDDDAMKAMNTLLAKLDDSSAGDDAGRTAYGQRPNLDDGTDRPAPAPADTSPGV